MVPTESSHIPRGLLKVAAVATAPLPVLDVVPVPAIVTIVFIELRTTLGADVDGFEVVLGKGVGMIVGTVLGTTEGDKLGN